MLTSPDFKELSRLFDAHDVKYLIVGGYAVMRYTEPRFTKDLDVLIAVNDENSTNLLRPSPSGLARAFGRVPPAVDLLIAATALANALPLYTRNPGNFAALAGLVEVVAL